MAKPVSLSNTFGTQPGPTIPLSYLDTNFSQLSGAINDTLSYSNYLVDSGAANAYVVTFSGTLSVAYTAGLMIQFKVGNNNTGTSTLNVNSLGAKTIKNTDGTNLASGQLPAGSIALVQYDGTNFQLLNNPSVGPILTSPLAISLGGTGLGSTPTNGQVLIGNGTGYSLSTLTAGSGVSIANGAGSITLTATGATGLPTLSLVAGTSQTAVTGTHYALTNVATTTLTLPATPAAGDLVYVTAANGLSTNVIARNSENIQGQASDYIMTVPYSSLQFRYINVTMGWAIIGWGPLEIGAEDYILESYGIV